MEGKRGENRRGAMKGEGGGRERRVCGLYPMRRTQRGCLGVQTPFSGVAIGWAGNQNPWGPSAESSQVPEKNKNKFCKF